MELQVTYDFKTGMVALPIQQWREIIKLLEKSGEVKEKWPEPNNVINPAAPQ